MGQIARLDTFMDFLFIVIVKDCPELRYWMYATSFWMVANLIFPITMLIKMLRLKHNLQQTMPYMESNNFLSFLRENMLLATVIDSFCIQNTIIVGQGTNIVFGRLMGGLSFFLQDFPQTSIHAFFKIYPYIAEHPPVHKYLTAQSLLLYSMIISGFAVCISAFNMIMCTENEFDPKLLELALHRRRREFTFR